jgi:hypothetical protein
MSIVTVRADLTPSSVHQLWGLMTVFNRTRERLYLGSRVDPMNNTHQQNRKGDADKLRNERHDGRYFAESPPGLADQFHDRYVAPD